MKKKTLKKQKLDQFETQEISPRTRVVAANMRLHPVLEKHVGYCLYKVALKFRSLIDGVLAQDDLIAPQFGMLAIIRATDSINQVTLGQQMALDKATIVKLIDGLEKKGYVVRVASETDRREKFLELTPSGEKFLDKIIPEMKSVEREFLSPLSAEERRVFLNAVPKLMNPKSE